ncbi:MAG: hypothetical protein A2Z96_07980 [Spirochaetes bacterium GWB1_48_6]|nr:MAG: hypothetical protein A2Z96_07980 [Spirochaetes bacterium GWB1_48_6]
MSTFGIVGLGTIGLKLVEYLAEKGFEVIGYNYRDVDTKNKKFYEAIERKIKYEKLPLSSFETVMNRVRLSENLADLADSTIIIDATKEDYDVKKKALEAIRAIVQEKDSIVATTTSSLSLERLARDSGLPDLVGMHFFNPPTRMKLIELALPSSFSQGKRAKLYKILASFDDKAIVEVPQVQGYIVNRILFAYLNFALEFMRTNNLAPSVVDSAMKLGTNSPMGPLELTDYIGNDVSLQILNEFYRATGDERYKPDQLLADIVSSGQLGRKTKQGFYQY